MVDVGAVKRNWDLVKRMGKSPSLQNFSDDKFHAKNDVKENWSLTKNIDLTLNATALILIKYIKVNVIHRVSNCYLAQTSSTLYWGTVTICNPSTEKNHPVGATKHLYKRVCPSVRGSVTPSLRRRKKVFRGTLWRVSGIFNNNDSWNKSFGCDFSLCLSRFVG